MMAAELSRLFAYDAWANAEAAASLAGMPTPSARASALMAHVVGAGWLWWARIKNSPTRFAVWPTFGQSELDLQIRDLAAAWDAYVSGASLAELARGVEYTNSRGERWSSDVSDILLHVVMHGAYHRGQVAALVRAAGAEPAYTDFIHAVRQGKVG